MDPTLHFKIILPGGSMYYDIFNMIKLTHLVCILKIMLCSLKMIQSISLKQHPWDCY